MTCITYQGGGQRVKPKTFKMTVYHNKILADLMDLEDACYLSPNKDCLCQKCYKYKITIKMESAEKERGRMR
jgi:hypothetical protein